jgi:transcriptional regulator with XRE-family HTH domain
MAKRSDPSLISPEIHSDPAARDSVPQAQISVGAKLRGLRARQGLSLRTLAERSGLNVNTLSLIENGKSSPSVSTLQQLALALQCPITAFFETEQMARRVVFTPQDKRPHLDFPQAKMENLGKDLDRHAVQPFVVTLEPGSGSGDQLIVHTGHEFVYCLSGQILYTIDGVEYPLGPGDSVVFESHLPHCWKNIHSGTSQLILTLYPADERDEPGGRHFPKK